MTDVVLPLQISLSKNTEEEHTSFRVLNQDNLPMTVLGERLFKPFGSDSQKRKPNGIVYPTRRIDLTSQQVNQQKQLAKSNGHLEVPTKQSTNYGNLRNLSASHGNLNQLSKQKSPDDFTKNLDAKLKKLQTEKRRADLNSNKKPFITTVKKGTFLEAPENSLPISKSSKSDEEESSKHQDAIKKQLYAYVSKPMVLSRSPPQQVHRSRCEAAAIAAGLPIANNDLKEGTTIKMKSRKKREVFSSDTIPLEKSSIGEKEQVLQKTEVEDVQVRKAREDMAKRRAIARKKAKIQSSKASAVNEIKQILRAPEYRVAEIQTEYYLQASLVKPPLVNMDVQTGPELLEEFCITDKNTRNEVNDKEAQVTPGEFFNFEEEIEPVLEILVGKTIESALVEILEEEELASLKEQQRRYLEMRNEEQRVAGELMEKNLVNRISRSHVRGVSHLLENYLVQLIPPVVEELKSENAVLEEEQLKNGSFLQWLIEEVIYELGDILSSGDVLKGMIRDILSRREEISSALDISQNHEEYNEFEKRHIVEGE